jgi:hypothetical protein
MSEKVIRLIRWGIVVVFISSTVLNNVWQGGTFLWAHWASAILFGGEFSILGLAFITSPKIMIRICVGSKNIKEGVPKWKFIIAGLIIGTPILILGVNLLALFAKRWYVECYVISNILCLPSVP